jgi:CBS domain-containing protein
MRDNAQSLAGLFEEEDQMTFVRQLLQGKPADIWTVAPETTVYKALELMAEKNVGALPVVADGELLGMFSERDYARKVVLKDRSSRAMTVRELMSHPALCVGPDDTIEKCMRLMTDRHVRHLPVCDQGHMAGMISIGDLLKAVIAEQEVHIRDLEHFINGQRA